MSRRLLSKQFCFLTWSFIFRRGSSSSGSSDWGSMDELENYTLKTFRRPLRPAAMASHHRKSQFKSRKSENSSTETEKVSKECTAETKKVPNESSPKVPSDYEANNHGTATAKATNGLDRLGATFSSVYRQKHQDQIREISQPTGFDSSLAKQVVARAQNFGKKFNFLQKEEVFGSDWANVTFRHTHTSVTHLLKAFSHPNISFTSEIVSVSVSVRILASPSILNMTSFVC